MSTFRKFRKNQKVWLATLGVLAMFSFVFIPVFQQGGRVITSGPKNVVTTKNFGSLSAIDIQNIQVRNGNSIAYLRGISSAFSEKIKDLDKAGAADPTAAEQVQGYMAAVQRLNVFMNMFSTGRNEAQAVNLWLAARMAEKAGIVVTDNQINEHMVFLTNSCLTNEVYTSVLESMRISLDEIRRGFRDIFLADEYLKLQTGQSYISVLDPRSNAFGLENQMPLSQKWGEFCKFMQRAVVEVYPVNAAQFQDQVADPTDKEVKDFFEAYKEKLPNPATGEIGLKHFTRMTVQYLAFNPEALAKPEEVTDEEIEKYYNENKAQFLKPADLDLPPVEATIPAEEPAPAPVEEPAPAPAEEPAPAPVEEPAAVPSESTSDTEPAPEAEVPTPETVAALPAENFTGTAEAAPEAQYYTPEEKRDEIRKAIALQKANAQILELTEAADLELRSFKKEISRYTAQLDPKTGKAPEGLVEPKMDMKSLEEKTGAKVATLASLDKWGLVEVAGLGESYTQNGPFVQEIQSLSDYTPVVAMSQETGEIYVAWKTESIESRVPELKEEGVREEVVLAIKMEKARQLAEAEAMDVAGKCRKDGSLAALGDAVKVSAPFSWYVQYSGQYQNQIAYGSVYVADSVKEAGSTPEFILNDPDEAFMSAIFGANAGDIIVVANAAKTSFFTVRIKEFTPDAKSLQGLFVQLSAQMPGTNPTNPQMYLMTLAQVANGEPHQWNRPSQGSEEF